MKNEVHIKSVYLMSSEFGLKSGKSMLKIYAQQRGSAFLVEITNWVGGAGGCNSSKWLVFFKFQLIGRVVVIVGRGS